MFVEVRIRKSSSRKSRENFYNERFEERLTCVSSATVKAIGRANVMHAPSKCGGVNIATLNLIRNNRLSATNVHVDRAAAQVGMGTVVTDVGAWDTGRTSVTHVYRDDDRINSK